MRGSAALREEAAFCIFKIQTWNAKIIHRLYFARRQRAGDIGELFFTRQARNQPFTIKLRQNAPKLISGFSGIINLPRIGVKRCHRQGNRQHFAITIRHRCARNWRFRRWCGRA